ncbi:MAG TPA: substrate binding domain-containing protein, partial [Noviherbaspirillum sp.]|nr:substrate binding domain-containing protein [Noviherbaspirillum sp.]
DQYQQQVRGLLRVSCSVAGRRQLVPLVTEFIALYPQVKVALQLEDRLVDLIAEQIDVAIRASSLVDSSLVAHKLAESPRVVVASPAYLARAGTPRTPQELTNHACLVYAGADRVYDKWNFIGENGQFKMRVNGVLQINDGEALATAAVGGAGIVLILRHLVADEIERGGLVELLSGYALPPAPAIYAVYPARDWLALKTSTFIAFLQERLGR